MTDQAPVKEQQPDGMSHGGGGGCGARAHAAPRLTQRRRTPSCRYHLDKVPVRLLCTYVGPGTEWLEDRDVDPLQMRFNRNPTCNEAVNRGQALQAHDAEVLLLRGQYPGVGRPVVHRSPAVAGHRRILLTVNPF